MNFSTMNGQVSFRIYKPTVWLAISMYWANYCHMCWALLPSTFSWECPSNRWLQGQVREVARTTALPLILDLLNTSAEKIYVQKIVRKIFHTTPEKWWVFSPCPVAGRLVNWDDQMLDLEMCSPRHSHRPSRTNRHRDVARWWQQDLEKG